MTDLLIWRICMTILLIGVWVNTLIIMGRVSH